jgi:hypothetical protein
MRTRLSVSAWRGIRRAWSAAHSPQVSATSLVTMSCARFYQPIRGARSDKPPSPRTA